MPLIRERVLDSGVEFDVETGRGGGTLTYTWGGDDVPRPNGSLLPAAAVALLPHSMRSGEDLEIEGEMTADHLDNLQEWVDAWSSLRPDLYQRVAVRSRYTSVREPTSRPRSTAVAYSGGVDSMHAVISLLQGRSPTRLTLVLAHGLDVPFGDDEAFRVALTSAKRTVDALGLPLSWVRTNWRVQFSATWEMDFMSGLGSVLQLWRHDACGAAHGSDEGSGYDFAVYPWSSNPATNPLLGCRDFPLRTIGHTASRVEKCATVATRPELLADVRVCFRPGAGGKNCGECYKCVRTRLCFAAAGIRDVPALGESDLVAALDAVHAQTRTKVRRMQWVLSHEPSQLTREERQAVERWIHRERLRTSAVGARVRRATSMMRPTQRRLLAAMGISAR